MKTEKLVAELVSWIKEKVIAAGCKGAVVGLSGGIDSSVLAALCKKAFPETTLGLLLPCGSNPVDAEHAKLVADKFGVPTQDICLDCVADAFHKELPTGLPEGSNLRLAESNLKPRLRMMTLYYFANRLNYMVVGSSNRDEITVGYFTKYGDGGVDIMPLGSLVKGQVRELARFLGVPQPIIDKPPTAGLWPGQTDEGEMGITYDELDRYLLTGEVAPPVRSRIEKMNAVSAHKRQMPSIADLSK